MVVGLGGTYGGWFSAFLLLLPWEPCLSFLSSAPLQESWLQGSQKQATKRPCPAEASLRVKEATNPRPCSGCQGKGEITSPAVSQHQPSLCWCTIHHSRALCWHCSGDDLTLLFLQGYHRTGENRFFIALPPHYKNYCKQWLALGQHSGNHCLGFIFQKEWTLTL